MWARVCKIGMGVGLTGLIVSIKVKDAVEHAINNDSYDNTNDATGKLPQIQYMHPANIHEIIHRFLADDRYAHMMRKKQNDEDSALILQPDLQDREENRLRYRRLMGVRRFIRNELPPDTIWYKCRILFDHDFDKHIHLVWPDLEDPIGQPREENELLDGILLFGHGDGEFMVLEGNHRYTRWRNSGRKPLIGVVYIAISSGNFCFYPGDVTTGYHEYNDNNNESWY